MDLIAINCRQVAAFAVEDMVCASSDDVVSGRLVLCPSTVCSHLSGQVLQFRRIVLKGASALVIGGAERSAEAERWMLPIASS